jgi:hypothetical protein
MSPFCIVVTADIIMNVYLLLPPDWLRDLNWNKIYCIVLFFGAILPEAYTDNFSVQIFNKAV